MLITFEGLDCSGKTTQAKLLAERLERMGKRVMILREPGGTTISERIREILLDKKHTQLNRITELFLFSASRAQLVSEVIKPALKKNYIVICDRFYDSTTAYQGWGRGIDIEGIQKIHTVATSGLVPDITFLIDIDASEATRRKKAAELKEDRMESSGRAFYEKVRKGYFELARKEPKRFVVLKGNKTIDEIGEIIWKTVSARLRKS